MVRHGKHTPVLSKSCMDHWVVYCIVFKLRCRCCWKVSALEVPSFLSSPLLGCCPCLCSLSFFFFLLFLPVPFTTFSRFVCRKCAWVVALTCVYVTQQQLKTSREREKNKTRPTPTGQDRTKDDTTACLFGFRSHGQQTNNEANT